MRGREVTRTRLACGKLNLFLEVMGPRTDGFHDIVSVFQEISLADRLTARAVEDERLSLTCDTPGIPTDERNLVLRAVALLRAAMGVRSGLHFHLETQLPVGGGLGGGSSDAAAALYLACEVWNLDLDREALLPIAAQAGSDVPFFLWGGTCLCEGRGERVTPLVTQLMPGLDFALILPAWEVSTVEAYAGLRPETFGQMTPDRLLRALSVGDVAALERESFNRFEETVFAMVPAQRRLRDALDRKSTRLNSSHIPLSRMPSSA